MFDPADPDNTPVTILVTEERWDAIDDPTPRNLLLIEMLTKIGGISNICAPGTYKFNILLDEKGQLVASLDLA